jgi:hypothetical protein
MFDLNMSTDERLSDSKRRVEYVLGIIQDNLHLTVNQFLTYKCNRIKLEVYPKIQGLIENLAK